MSVELRQVSKRFGPIMAVHELNLALAAGEFFCLLGPSGCGKTTILRLIGGLERPDSGDIAIDGEVVTGRPAYERRANIVFQQYALFPHLNIWDNVAFGLRVQSQRLPATTVKQRVTEALELVQLGAVGSRRPQQLSGGQQQRVALARALVLRPQVLLLDEPLGALDRQLRRTMQGELCRIQREVQMTFLYVTHDQEEALSMADRLAVMQQGRLEQVGTPQQVFEQPRSRFVAEFMGVANILAGRIIGVDTTIVQLETPQGMRLLAPNRADLPLGATASAVIRPDAVHISPLTGEVSRPNTITGRITSKVYLGEVTEITVALPGNQTFLCRLPSRVEQRYGYQDKQTVHLTWEVADCHILAE
jgi:spermidine/putrescine transport system ATP-binding protein